MVRRCKAVIVANPIPAGPISEKLLDAVKERRDAYMVSSEGKAALKRLTTSRIWCIVELFSAMQFNKPIIFRCLHRVPSITVTRSPSTYPPTAIPLPQILHPYTSSNSINPSRNNDPSPPPPSTSQHLSLNPKP